MPRLLSLSRAARLVGVSRGELQKKIMQGEVESFEGKIRISDLEKAYPDFQLEDNTIIENIERIIEQALQRARGEKLQKLLTPDFETLLSRLNILSQELARTQQQIHAFSVMFSDLQQYLKTLSDKGSAELLEDIDSWLAEHSQAIDNLQPKTAPLLVHDTVLQVVAAQVHLQPSGHEFFVEGNNSVLEAGLSAGLALNYGCSNGNCGKCRARLISGKVRKTRDYDFSFSESEKIQNYFLTCSHTPVTDIVIEADEADSVRDIPLQDIDAKVKKLEQLDSEYLVLSLKTPRTQRLRFLAGQLVTLSSADNLQQQLPIASCPCDDMNIQFHLPLHPETAFTQHIYNQLKTGETIHIQGPQGNFVLDDDSNAPLIFIAVETGFAPIKSLIEHALTLDNAQFSHLYWLHQHDYPYLHNHCRAWQDALETFRYTHIGIDDKQLADSCRARIERITEDYSNLDELIFYLCGPQAVVDVIGEFLITAGAEKEHIHTQAL